MALFATTPVNVPVDSGGQINPTLALATHDPCHPLTAVVLNIHVAHEVTVFKPSTETAREVLKKRVLFGISITDSQILVLMLWKTMDWLAQKYVPLTFGIEI